MSDVLCDDDELRTRPFRDALEVFEGLKVDFVRSPLAAINMIRRSKEYRCIVLDIMLPHQDSDQYKSICIGGELIDNSEAKLTGIAVLQQIESLLGGRVPIIVLTCRRDTGSAVERATSSGAIVVNKDIGLGDWIEVVRNQLKGGGL